MGREEGVAQAEARAQEEEAALGSCFSCGLSGAGLGDAPARNVAARRLCEAWGCRAGCLSKGTSSQMPA